MSSKNLGMLLFVRVLLAARACDCFCKLDAICFLMGLVVLLMVLLRSTMVEEIAAPLLLLEEDEGEEDVDADLDDKVLSFAVSQSYFSYSLLSVDSTPIDEDDLETMFNTPTSNPKTALLFVVEETSVFLYTWLEIVSPGIARPPYREDGILLWLPPRLYDDDAL